MNDVALSPAARDWIREHGGAVTLRAAPRHGCCGGHAAVPVAEARVPAVLADFECKRLDGVEVYRAPGLSDGPYRIELEGFGRWRRLAVQGAVGPWRSR